VSDHDVHATLDALMVEVRAIRALLEAKRAPKVDSNPVTAREVQAFLDAWNENCGGLPKAVTAGAPDSKRHRDIVACIKQERNIASWGMAAQALSQSSHHRGQNQTGWVADIDFLAAPSNRTRWWSNGQALPAKPKVAQHRELWCGCGKQAIHGPGTRNPDTAAEPKCAGCWA
jgi:hypothetical protein